MITTRESINYQFSLIFGYSSPNDLVVGDVIGPGRLTRKKINELSQEVIKYLTMYNAILRDYTGSEVFSIEFELYNMNEKSSQTNIYPKSMIFIPGQFKDCESLILALKPETGYLDVHKSRDSLNKISQLFFEVEEFTNRPELQISQKCQIYDKFAARFSKKLFGDLIEDKWNKKLIGLSTSLPTEKELLNSYAKIKSDVEIKWSKTQPEINLLNAKFEKVKSPFQGQQAIEHLKYSISEPSANFVVDKTINLGTNLINLANIGTLDESQDSVILFLLTWLKQKLENIDKSITAEELISYFDKILIELQGYLNKFLDFSGEFLISGESGDLDKLLDKYLNFIGIKGKLENVSFDEICKISVKFINESTIQKHNLRITELSSAFNYIGEIIKSSVNLIKLSLPQYLSRRRLKILTNKLLENLKLIFSKEQKPAKILGYKLIDKFEEYLVNQIETNSLILMKRNNYNDLELKKEFEKLVNENIDFFFDSISLKIEDLISFAELQMQDDIAVIKMHTERFKKLSSELHYLLSYLLRYSTINRFIKEEPDKEITDPVTFANRFHRFLEKRIGGIKLEWKSYILEWIMDYAKKFFHISKTKELTLIEIYNDFIEYFEKRELKEQRIENFLEFLDNYIIKINNSEEKSYLLEFYKQYEHCININVEFPKYIKEKIKKELRSLDFKEEILSPINYIEGDKEDNLYNYIKNWELKYFSKLIPRPLTLILKHSLTSEERDLFKEDLYHVLAFKFWHKNARFELSDNFKEVYREWWKQL